MTLLRSDRQLLEAFRAGERWALERVYWEYVDTVAAIVRHGLSLSRGQRIPGVWSDEASELVQETFLRAFGDRARHAYDGVREYRPYLLTICRNLLIDHARRRGREIPTDQELDAVLTDGPDASPAEEPWADRETMRAVEEYVGGLEPQLRNLYHQRYELGVSQVAAAESLGLTRQRVRTLENKLRKGLSRFLRRRSKGRA